MRKFKENNAIEKSWVNPGRACLIKANPKKFTHLAHRSHGGPPLHIITKMTYLQLSKLNFMSSILKKS